MSDVDNTRQTETYEDGLKRQAHSRITHFTSKCDVRLSTKSEEENPSQIEYDGSNNYTFRNYKRRTKHFCLSQFNYLA